MMVKVYEKDDCQACVLTKRKLDAAGIPYEVADLMEPMNLEAAKSLGHLSAPVVVAGDEHWSGFRPANIDALAKRMEETK